MNQEKFLTVRVLKWCYIATLTFSISIVAVTHVFPHEVLLVFRVPTYLREIDPYIGHVWPKDMVYYHFLLVISFISMALATIGLHKLKNRRWKQMAYLATIFALASSVLISLFFLQTLSISSHFATINRETAYIYSFFSLVLLTLNSLSVLVLIGKEKIARFILPRARGNKK